MKVIFNCNLYKFHKFFYKNIADELKRRNHDFEFVYDDERREADFTIIADEYQKSLGGKSVWIGHGFDAKGAMINDPYYLGHLQENADYVFAYSEEYKNVLKKYITKPIYVAGMAKLDGLFNIKRDKMCILYAPTFNKELSADTIITDGLNTLSSFGELIIRRHPAFEENPTTSYEPLKKASIIISDYSSIGMEGIILNIPTILVNNPDKDFYKTFPDKDYICNRARVASIEVNNLYEIGQAIEKYKLIPTYLKDERIKYGKILCEYQNKSAKRTVDLLEKLL